jgi:hypothetical protein
MIDIGMQLKSDEMIEFLELYDLPVEYHFDRLHEGESDSYTVESEELSLELQFDADQRCVTIFVRDPEVAIARRIVAFPNLRSPTEVEAYAKTHSLAITRGPLWLRCDGAERSIHYEFDGATPKMVTIMSPDVAPKG